MAREDWYKINNHLKISDEDKVLSTAQVQFMEMLESDLASDIVLYESDMSEDTKVEMRAIVEGNHPNTKLKSMERYLLVPIGSCKAGQYIVYKDKWWLITGLVDSDNMCDKAIILMCNYDLHWQNADDKIVHRWTNIVSNAQYNTGISENNYYALQSDQLAISLPMDSETLAIDVPMRFIIGYGVNRKCYKVTRPDTVPLFYGDNEGILNVIVAQDVINEATDIGNICDYREPNFIKDESSNISIDIKGSTTIKACGKSRKYTANVVDENGNEVLDIVSWEVNDFVIADISDNTISLSVDNDKYIGETITLVASIGEVKTQFNINVVSLF